MVNKKWGRNPPLFFLTNPRSVLKYPMKPITPEEVKNTRPEIPDEVISAVNKLLVKNSKGNVSRIVIFQKDIIRELENYHPSHVIFENNWLDFEKFYETAGWTVDYDKPGYNETYSAHFIFKAKQ